MKKNSTIRPAIVPQAPEAKPEVAQVEMQVCIFPLEKYNTAMQWAYNNLTAAQYHEITGRMGQPSVGNFAPGKQ